MSLKGKKILLAISGSISAYKMPHLVRLLVKAGADVKVVMTQSATQFVTPLTLNVVSKNPVLIDMFTDAHDWNNHVHLALWADALIVAPMSANTLARCAQGLCENLLDAVYLSARSPVFFAPAMDEDMWQHEAVQKNIDILINRKNHHYIPVGEGELASGLVGPGRLAEIEDIFQFIDHFFVQLEPKIPIQALVTAGPTYENIDPVRFIGNFSSGKMGIAVAESLAKRCQMVHLVLGPHVEYTAQYPNIIVHHVWSAQSMLDTCESLFPQSAITIMSAAVADFRPAEIQTSKIKKTEGDNTMTIELVKNPDILYTLGHKKTADQLVIGFALETDNELGNARKKLIKKNADYIALNSLQDSDVGFGKDTNRIILLSPNQENIDLGSDTKTRLAEKMINFIIDNNKEKLTHHIDS